MIKYSCPKCRALLESPTSLAGQYDDCPVCRSKNVVPRRQKSKRALWLALGGAGGVLVLTSAIVLTLQATKRAAAPLIQGPPQPDQSSAALLGQEGSLPAGSSTARPAQRQPKSASLAQLLDTIKNDTLQPVQGTGGGEFDVRLGAVVWLTGACMKLGEKVAVIQSEQQETDAVKALVDLLQRAAPVGNLDRSVTFQATYSLTLLRTTCEEAAKTLTNLQNHSDPVISSQAKLHAAFAVPLPAEFGCIKCTRYEMMQDKPDVEQVRSFAGSVKEDGIDTVGAMVSLMDGKLVVCPVTMTLAKPVAKDSVIQKLGQPERSSESGAAVDVSGNKCDVTWLSYSNGRVCFAVLSGDDRCIAIRVSRSVGETSPGPMAQIQPEKGAMPANTPSPTPGPTPRPTPGEPRKPSHPSTVPGTPPASAADFEFELKASGRAMDFLSNEALDHAQQILGGKFTIVAAAQKDWAVQEGRGWVSGKLNKEAFTAAVKSVTPDRLKQSQETTGEPGSVVFLAVVGSAAAFVRASGQFDDQAFIVALSNLDKEKIQKCATLTGARKSVVLGNLLAVCAKYVKDEKFDAAAFNAKLAALREGDFSGSEAEKMHAVMEAMRPATSPPAQVQPEKGATPTRTPSPTPPPGPTPQSAPASKPAASAPASLRGDTGMYYTVEQSGNGFTIVIHNSPLGDYRVAVASLSAIFIKFTEDKKHSIIELRISNVNGHYSNGDGSLDARMRDRSLS